MTTEKIKHLIAFNIFTVISLFLIEIISSLSSPLAFCLVPRETSFLTGIPLMHFDHGNMSHLGSNLLPLMAFGSIITFRNSIPYTIKILATTALLSGTLLWAFGQNGCHIGASAVIFALWGFIVSQGIFTRCPKDIIIGILIGLAYASLVYGLSPFQEGVSWDGHLYGLISGVLTAYLFKNRKKQNKI